MAKVAVVSTDGVTINEHFGKAKEFLVYEVQENGSFELVERRLLEGESPSNIHGNAAKFIADVEAVLAAQIGPRIEQELRRQGIIALPVTGDIQKALEAYGKRGKFIRNGAVRPVVSECGSGCGGCRQGCQ